MNTAAFSELYVQYFKYFFVNFGKRPNKDKHPTTCIPFFFEVQSFIAYNNI